MTTYINKELINDSRFDVYVSGLLVLRLILARES